MLDGIFSFGEVCKGETRETKNHPVHQFDLKILKFSMI